MSAPCATAADDQSRPIISSLSRLTAWLGVPLLLVGLIALFFNKMAFSNLILARGDTFLYFYPYWQVAADALRSGRVPLWNPDIFMGVPFSPTARSDSFTRLIGRYGCYCPRPMPSTPRFCSTWSLPAWGRFWPDGARWH